MFSKKDKKEDAIEKGSIFTGIRITFFNWRKHFRPVDEYVN